MPYITQRSRNDLKDGRPALTPGELNYQITKLIDEYVGHNLTYTKINDVVGVLECAKQEFYRRVAAPYEDEKQQANGDVYRERSWK